MSATTGMQWRGRPIDELSRDELIAIIRELSQNLALYQTPEMARAIGLGQAHMLRKS